LIIILIILIIKINLLWSELCLLCRREEGPGSGARVLVEHPRIPVEAAVHTGLPVALVRQHVVLETGGTLLLGSHAA